jgi:hypothetical protein
VQKAGLAELRKGQKISFEIFDNQGKAAAKNLRVSETMKDASKHELVAIQKRGFNAKSVGRCGKKIIQPADDCRKRHRSIPE